MGRSDELLQALRSRPEDPQVACNLADAFAEEGQFKKAVLVYQHSVQHDPHLARAWYGGGCADIARSEFAAAADWFRKALALQPDWLEATHNLARCLYELGSVTEAFSLFFECGRRSERSLAMAALIAPGVPELDHSAILEVRQAWASQIAPSTSSRRTDISTPLRVGYVSSFFHRDNWMKPVWGLIHQHNPAVVDVTLFSDGPSRFSSIDTRALSNDELAALIGQYRIDLLVDLNGYSNLRRLPMFANRIAPVMLGWFNMYATTGINAFDYLIGDHSVVAPDEERFYSEKILRVDGSYLTFDVTYPVPEISDRSAAAGFVFGALASAYKITDQVIAAWSRILHRRPNSSLLIKNQQMSSASGRDHLLARFQEHAISADRLQIEQPEEHFDFLQAYGRIDLALDTFPYNGGTTTTEAIWQGVPVVTFHGDRWASRTSASILNAAGLGQFVARDLESYINLAATVDPRPLRSTMREKLRASPVCDTRSFARQMESLYLKATADLSLPAP